jgi:excisionase family DNA binding protein
LFFLNRHDADFEVVKETSVLPKPRRRSMRPPFVFNRLFLHDAAFSLTPLTPCQAESISDRNGEDNAMNEHNGRGNHRDRLRSLCPLQSRKHRHRSPQLPAENSVAARRGAIPFAQRLACTVAEACEATGLGRTKLYALIGEGKLDTTTIGRRRLVMVPALLKLFGTQDK